jgi:hypothetical protein
MKDNESVAVKSSRPFSLTVSIIRLVFAVIVFVIFSGSALYVTKKMKYKFAFKYYVNLTAFAFGMAINIVFCIISIKNENDFIRNI